MARASFTCNDAFLFGALFYSSVILLIKWEDYAQCPRPMHVFLLVDYITVVVFRISQYFTARYRDSERPFARSCTQFCKVGVVFSFFVGWTITGSVWFAKSSSCLPEKNQYYTVLVWLLLCYCWIIGYGCVIWLRYTWFSDSVNFNNALEHPFPLSIVEMDRNPGLTEAQINEIPTFLCPPQFVAEKCPICIDVLAKDSVCKKLPNCPHFFHAQCVNEWLERKSNCPVCRTEVSMERNGQVAMDEPQINDEDGVADEQGAVERIRAAVV